MIGNQTLWIWIVFVVGWVALLQGLYWLKTGKARSHWYSGLRLIDKEQNPHDYWLYVGLSIGIGASIVILIPLAVFLGW